MGSLRARAERRTTSTVLLDTNVFTAWLRPQSPLVPLYGKHVIGRRITVSQQTIAEVRYGAIAAGWRKRQLDGVERLLRRSRVLPVDDQTTWAYARLRHECRTVGHPLQQKQHLGELWIAATAICWQLAIVAHGAVFLDCPNL